MMHTRQNSVPAFVISRIAAASHVGERTVRRALAGERVLPVTALAVTVACKALGIDGLLPQSFAEAA